MEEMESAFRDICVLQLEHFAIAKFVTAMKDLLLDACRGGLVEQLVAKDFLLREAGWSCTEPQDLRCELKAEIDNDLQSMETLLAEQKLSAFGRAVWSTDSTVQIPVSLTVAISVVESEASLATDDSVNTSDSPAPAIRQTRGRGTGGVGQLINGRRVGVNQLHAELLSGHLEPHTLIEPFKYGDEKGFAPGRSQPFQVVVHPQVSLVTDWHSHLSECEVIGLLAGRWCTEENTLYVQVAIPCAASSSVTGATDVEMDAESEWAARERIAAAGLSVVGWYHSHPKFRAQPSLIDVANQRQSQRHASSVDDTSGTSEEDSMPFVGLIVSTFCPQATSSESEFQWFMAVDYRPTTGSSTAESAGAPTTVLPVSIDVTYANINVELPTSKECSLWKSLIPTLQPSDQVPSWTNKSHPVKTPQSRPLESLFQHLSCTCVYHATQPKICLPVSDETSIPVGSELTPDTDLSDKTTTVTTSPVDDLEGVILVTTKDSSEDNLTQTNDSERKIESDDSTKENIHLESSPVEPAIMNHIENTPSDNSIEPIVPTEEIVSKSTDVSETPVEAEKTTKKKRKINTVVKTEPVPEVPPTTGRSRRDIKQPKYFGEEKFESTLEINRRLKQAALAANPPPIEVKPKSTEEPPAKKKRSTKVIPKKSEVESTDEISKLEGNKLDSTVGSKPNLEEDAKPGAALLDRFKARGLPSTETAVNLLATAPKDLRGAILTILVLGFAYSRSSGRIDLGRPWRGKTKFDKVAYSVLRWVQLLVHASDNLSSPDWQENFLSQLETFLRQVWEDYSRAGRKLLAMR